MSRHTKNILHYGTTLSWFISALMGSGLVTTLVHAALPDLVIDKPRLASSVLLQVQTFPDGDCAIVEGCAPGGTRRLLKFDVGFKNIGAGDLAIGDPNARPDLFEWSPCHGHFHLHGAANYELLSAAGDVVLRARKQAFCLRDDTQFNPATGPAKFNCDFQGISPGWEDMYPRELDCQWLDVTGLAGGTYLLRVIVNPEQVFEESNYANNAASVSINLPVKNPPPASQPPPPQMTPSPTKTSPPKVTQPEPAWKKLADKYKQKAKKKGHLKHKKRPKPPPPPEDDNDQGEQHE